ncbi:MAG: aldo/keto reductase, partial [Erysipelotrichaceae bacterium]|nr:aldo/keto reductase [Erysipelotrichaceae bacterium]
MDGVKKNFGFGCMRLPQSGEEVNKEELCRMVDYFLDNGFNYFDTAHGYLDGKSETALKECLTSRYDRDSYILTNKLTGVYFQTKDDIRPFFESQLDACGVDYFDYYLMHAQSAEKFEHFKNCEAYETAFALKEEGKVKHVGISFHDTADVLDRILTEYPQVEIVQLQFNYIDYEDPAVQSRKCYEVCRKHNKPVIVMEPVKGGTLVKLPDEAKRIFDALNGGSYANYAIRFAASFEGIEMVLSGMSSYDQMVDNVRAMKEFRPFTKEEYDAVKKVCEVFRGLNMIPCTACRYCEAGCPKQIHIPDLFSLMNAKKIFNDFGAGFYYNTVHT